MRLSDLTKNLSEMTTEELQAHVREIRSKKYIEKPATKKRAADVEKKEHNTARRGVNSLLDGMSDEQKQELLKLLEDGNG